MTKQAGSLTRSMICGAVLLITFFVIFFNIGYLIPESVARDLTYKKLKSFISDSGKDPAQLKFLKETAVTGARWGFEWLYNGSPNKVYGVYMRANGEMEIYSRELELNENSAESDDRDTKSE